MATKTWREFLVQFRKAEPKKASLTARKASAARAQEIKQNQPKPPLFLILMSHGSDKENIATSIYEVKAGVRGATSGMLSSEAFDMVCNNGKIKTAIEVMQLVSK